MRRFELFAVSPTGFVNAALPVAAGRAGATGLLDLSLRPDALLARQALAQLSSLAGVRGGVLLDAADLEGRQALLPEALTGLGTVVLTRPTPEALARWLPAARGLGLRVLVEVTDGAQAIEAEAGGADALIVKGNEAGGAVGQETTFILLQRVLSEVRVPVLARGGIGPHTAAACRAGGAAGVVLDGQLLLTRESRLPAEVRATLAQMDGAETVVAGAERGELFRCYAPPGSAVAEELRLAAPDAGDWREWLGRRVGWDLSGEHVWPLGEDAALARRLGERYVTVGGVLGAIRQAVETDPPLARRLRPLAAGAPLAVSHGTRFPLVQGPMSRVSDRPEFARAVAEAGALPFLALGLMRGTEAATVLAETAALLQGAPWGVGLLGFIPPEHRAEQILALRRHRPGFAVLAGGRPDQARALEQEGLATYLHVPSPELLRLFLQEGARRFVLEGRECGGHVGPRSSFPLWEAMLAVLLEEVGDADAADLHVLFAGGLHDARSAAMVAALAAPLAERSMKVGAVLGSAYLFTEEALATGAICAPFQEQALACRETVLLESRPGHAIRCAPTPFAAEFLAEKRRLQREGLAPEEIARTLEVMNLGRLRLAARGLDRECSLEQGGETGALTEVPAEEQRRRGAYMIGQLGALRRHTTTLGDLHREVSTESHRHLCRVLGRASATARRHTRARPHDIALVGMSCILPGAPHLQRYWENILGKVCAFTEVPPTHWNTEVAFTTDRRARDRSYSRWGGFFDPVPFDPVEWGLPPSAVPSIDAMQLIALVAAREALQDAGYARRPFDRSRAAVIMGVSSGIGELGGLYVLRSGFPLLFGHDAWRLLEQVGDNLPQWTEDSFPGILPNVVAGRIANRLDLSGPNYSVDAACASSLAAVDAAVKELTVGEVDLALVGGVDTLQGLFGYTCFSATQALSPRGQARVFDAEADGIVMGEGAAMVVLKRRAEAERDGDRIYALLQGTGSSSDGRGRGLTAPRPEGQLQALRRAYARSGLSPSSVELFEAHGTGTVAGDRSEAECLATLAREAGAAPRSQALGSVKSMIGHTKGAAGVAGLIKVALALHHRVLPPTLGVTHPLPGADFEAGPLYLNSETRPWLHPAGSPRRAAVSAFGFGGTNFHTVLEEYTGDPLGDAPAACEHWPAELLVWAEPSREALAAALSGLATQLDAGAAPELRDLAFNLWQRAAGALQPEDGNPITLALVATDLDDLRAKLTVAGEALAGTQPIQDPRGLYCTGEPRGGEGRLAFLFPGQGSQYPHMLRDLAVHFPEVRTAFETAQEALESALPAPLGRLVFPPPAFTPEEERRQQEALVAGNVAQPALGAASLGMLRLLEALGLRPHLVAGHSFGEYTALAAAGVIDAPVLARLGEARGRFMAQALGDEPGAMAAVQAGAEELQALLGGRPGVWVANLNSPAQTVLAGTQEGIASALALLEGQGIRARRLPVAGAYHSPLVAGAQARLAELLAATPLHDPRAEVFSNTTAAPYPTGGDAMRRLLVTHVGSAVRFAEEIEAMYEAGARVFVEVGPRAVLTTLVRQTLGDRPHLALPTDSSDRDGVLQLLHTLGRLLAHGVPLSLDRLFAHRQARRLDLQALVEETQPRPLSPTTWLVTSCRSWPAHEPPPLRPVALLHGDAGRPCSSDAGPGATDEEREVLRRHQEFMSRLAETEREIMGWFRDTAPPGEPPSAAGGGLPAASGGPQATEPAAPPDLARRFLEIVSERTGYPPEKLALDLHMEADLGIDSIKRMEILGAVQRQCLAGGATLGPAALEELLGLTTLRGVIAWLQDADQAQVCAPAEREEAPRPAPQEVATGDPQGAAFRRIVMTSAAAPALPRADAAFPAAGVFLITDDERGVAEALADGVRAGGGQAFVVRHRPAAEAAGERGEADLTSLASVRDLVEQVRRAHGPLRGLVHLLPLAEGLDTATRDLATWRHRLRCDVKSLFYLAQAAQADLQQNAEGERSWLVSAMASGTLRDATGPPPTTCFPGHGGLAGFVKTAAREWPNVRCKAVDLDPSADPALLAAQLLAEMAADDGLVEVGHAAGARWVPDYSLEALDPEGRPRLQPDSDWVFLLTGGARGITAEVACELAERFHPTLILVGSSPPPAAESPETDGVSALADLKAALQRQLEREGAPAGIREVERAHARLLRAREIRSNLARLAQAGATVEYHQADVRDEAALSRVLTQVRQRHGRLDVVLHGAGVLEDKLIRDKTAESFDRVFDTKAEGAFLLSRLVDLDSLQCLMLFGSIAGATGSRGQCDYAAANALLSACALQLDQHCSARVVALAWGPWGGRGMVHAELEQEFRRQGLALLPLQTGRRLCVEELLHGPQGQARVLLAGGHALESRLRGRPRGEAAALPLLYGASLRHNDGETLEVLRTLDPAHDLYLDHHRLFGRPVLPMTFAAELMAEAALQMEPGLQVTGMHELRVLKGVVLRNGPLEVKVSARRRPAADAGDTGALVEVELAETGNGSRASYRATVQLGERLPEPPPYVPALAEQVEPFTMGMAEAYERYTFHGPLLQALVQVEGVGARGAVGLLRPSSPQGVLAAAPEGDWLLDPVLFDAGLQLGLVWSRTHHDVTALPARFGRCCLFTRPVPGEVRCWIEGEQSEGGLVMEASMYLLDREGHLVGLLEHFEATGSRALNSPSRPGGR